MADYKSLADKAKAILLDFMSNPEGLKLLDNFDKDKIKTSNSPMVGSLVTKLNSNQFDKILPSILNVFVTMEARFASTVETLSAQNSELKSALANVEDFMKKLTDMRSQLSKQNLKGLIRQEFASLSAQPTKQHSKQNPDIGSFADRTRSGSNMGPSTSDQMSSGHAAPLWWFQCGWPG